VFEKSISDLKVLEEKENKKRNEKYKTKTTNTLQSLTKECANFLNIVVNMRISKTLSDVVNHENLKGCGFLLIVLSILLLFITYLQKN